MIALIALVLVALPAYYTIDSNTKLNGSVSYQRQLSKDSYISQTGSASFYYSDLNFGLGYSHSNDDGEDTDYGDHDDDNDDCEDEDTMVRRWRRR